MGGGGLGSQPRGCALGARWKPFCLGSSAPLPPGAAVCSRTGLGPLQDQPGPRPWRPSPGEGGERPAARSWPPGDCRGTWRLQRDRVPVCLSRDILVVSPEPHGASHSGRLHARGQPFMCARVWLGEVLSRVEWRQHAEPPRPWTVLAPPFGPEPGNRSSVLGLSNLLQVLHQWSRATFIFLRLAFSLGTMPLEPPGCAYHSSWFPAEEPSGATVRSFTQP